MQQIRLDLSANSPLNWEVEPKDGIPILWCLDFGFDRPGLSFTNQIVFGSHLLAMESFCEKVLPAWVEETHGVLMYRGNGLFHDQIASDLQLGEHLDELRGQLSEDISLTRSEYLFSINLLMEYLHRLGSRLPEEVQGYVDLQLEGGRSVKAQLLSKERFAHIWQLGEEADVQVGVCLPPDGEFNREVDEAFESILIRLEELGIAYRVIPEGLIFEEWSGIDHLVVIGQVLSFDGRRNLRGFNAAGGNVVYWGEPLDLVYEEPFEAFCQRSKGGVVENLVDV
ncbi:MAG: hypothetical protein S4CHLAM102_16180 [Chlamydiia bacterium]|nr:hypothetical protein [Chlamydiia bacterium]